MVVDKPVGVAAHPSVGWTGPDGAGSPGRRRLPDLHLRRARAAGHRAATRRRHLGADGGGQERARVHGAEARLPLPYGRQDVPHPGAGPPGPVRGHHRRTDRAASQRGVQDGRDRGRPAQRHPLRHPATRSSAPPCSKCSLETGRTHQIRVHMAAIHHPCVGDPTYGRDPVLAARLGLERQWLHAVRLGFVASGPRRAGHLQLRLPRRISSTPWTSSRAPDAWIGRVEGHPGGSGTTGTDPFARVGSCVEPKSSARWGRPRPRPSDSSSWSQAGMDVARLNMSHGDYSDHEENLQQRPGRPRQTVGRPVGVLADLQGPKIRLGRFASGKETLVDGARFAITVDDIPGDRRVGARRRTRACRATCAPGDRILIDDGRLALRGRRGRPHRRHHRGHRRRRRQQQQGHQPARRRRQRAGDEREGHRRPALGAAARRRHDRAVLRPQRRRHRARAPDDGRGGPRGSR